jgi:putative hydrolase of the HAD superfamily
MKRAVLFDLGNTLAEYFESCTYPELLPLCIREAADFVARAALPRIGEETLWRRVEEENREGADHRVRPLEDRLLRIFGLEPSDLPAETVSELCAAFMKPIFGLGRCYEDTLPALRRLREEGVQVGSSPTRRGDARHPSAGRRRGGSGSSISRTRSSSART